MRLRKPGVLAIGGLIGFGFSLLEIDWINTLFPDYLGRTVTSVDGGIAFTNVWCFAIAFRAFHDKFGWSVPAVLVDCNSHL